MRYSIERSRTSVEKARKAGKTPVGGMYGGRASRARMNEYTHVMRKELWDRQGANIASR